MHKLPTSHTSNIQSNENEKNRAALYLGHASRSVYSIVVGDFIFRFVEVCWQLSQCSHL